MVLHELGLVQDDRRPLPLPVLLGVQPDQGVRGHDDVRPLDRLVQREPGLARRLRDDSDGQLGGEAGGLPRPALDHAGRGDDEEPGVGSLLQDVEDAR